MQRKLLLLSFLEGAAVMAAELCGARLLAPIFGNSLYVWAVVMALTLGALATGYFVGGKLSMQVDRRAQLLALLLSSACIFLLFMPVFSFYVIPRLSYLSFFSGMALSAFLLLLPPVFLLGATSPLFISLQTDDSAESGKISGSVYAISTAGGILATVTCGFIFIPQLGLQYTLVLFAFILFGFTALFLRRIHFLFLLLMLTGAYLNWQIGRQRAELLLQDDGIMGEIVVRDVRTASGMQRLLLINQIIQSEADLKTMRSTSAYLMLLDSLLPSSVENKRALVLGLGAGLSAEQLWQKGYETEAVEFDGRITEAARRFFYLRAQIKTYTEDARCFLNRTSEKYDLILADLFKAEEQPSHVFTLESLRALRMRNLTPDGRLLITWHGYYDLPLGKGTQVLLNTLHRAGFKTRICAQTESEASRNLLIIASSGEPLHYQHEQDLAAIGTQELNTDDHPCLESNNARANKAWREAYLRYYQNYNKSGIHQ
jgi:spermidine synthase